MNSIKKLYRKVSHWIRQNPEKVKVCCIALSAVLIVSMSMFGLPGQKSLSQETNDLTLNEETSLVSENELLCVYICGQVEAPGVYYVARGSRVCDVAQLAGGLCEDAALETINLAREVKDGEQIVVRALEEVSSGLSESSSGGSLLVNINTASGEQLEQLPGVGPSLAARIVSYRNAQGAFTSVDDLKNVSGIGDKKLESFREYVCV